MVAHQADPGSHAINGGALKPSEEEEGQINIKGDRATIDRFRKTARRDGLRLIGLLRRALDAYVREPQ